MIINFTGTYFEYVVPAGVTSLPVKLWGAQGGNDLGGSGGLGGYLEATINVVPGETLRFYVGGHPGGRTGGFNGGGDGGLSTADGAGGGGATDVRRAPYGLADRLAVAGGGGGAGSYGGPGSSGYSYGGHGGGADGEDGWTRGGGGPSDTQQGTAGTGKKGTTSTYGLGGDTPEGDGALGLGGTAHQFTGGTPVVSSGGGGGGLYGGGAGGFLAAGWGAGGGGGSGGAPGGTVTATATGNRTGHGLAIIPTPPPPDLECVQEYMTDERGSPPDGIYAGPLDGNNFHVIGTDGPNMDFSVEMWGYASDNNVDEDWIHGGTFLFDGLNYSAGQEMRIKLHKLSTGGLMFWFVDSAGSSFNEVWYLPSGADSTGPDPDKTQLHQYGWIWHHLTGQLEVFFDGEQVPPAAGYDGILSVGDRAEFNSLPSNASVPNSRNYGSRPGFGSEFTSRLIDIRTDPAIIHDAHEYERNYRALCESGNLLYVISD